MQDQINQMKLAQAKAFAKLAGKQRAYRKAAKRLLKKDTQQEASQSKTDDAALKDLAT